MHKWIVALQRAVLGAAALAVLTLFDAAAQSYSLSNANLAYGMLYRANAINNSLGTVNGGGQPGTWYATSYAYESDPNFSAQNAIGTSGSGANGWWVYTDCSGWVGYLLDGGTDSRSAFQAVQTLASNFKLAQLANDYWPQAYIYTYYLRNMAPKLSQLGNASSAPGPFINVDQFQNVRAGDILNYCLGAYCTATPTTATPTPGDTGHIMLVTGTPTVVVPASTNNASNFSAGYSGPVTVYQVPVIDETIVTHNLYPTNSAGNTVQTLQANFATQGYPGPVTTTDSYANSWTWSVRRNFYNGCQNYNDGSFAPGRNAPCGGAGPGYINVAVDANGNAFQFQFMDKFGWNGTWGQTPYYNAQTNAQVGVYIVAGRALPAQ